LKFCRPLHGLGFFVRHSTGWHLWLHAAARSAGSNPIIDL
jgi:hypothetical protein